jgi:hypothetical protein
MGIRGTSRNAFNDFDVNFLPDYKALHEAGYKD